MKAHRRSDIEVHCVQHPMVISYMPWPLYPGTKCTGSWMSPRPGLYIVKEKISYLIFEVNSRSPGTLPIHSLAELPQI